MTALQSLRVDLLTMSEDVLFRFSDVDTETGFMYIRLTPCSRVAAVRVRVISTPLRNFYIINKYIQLSSLVYILTSVYISLDNKNMNH